MYLYNNGIIEFSGVLISTVAMMSSFGPVIAISNLGNSLAQTIASGHRVLDLLEEKSQVEEVVNQKDIVFNGLKMEGVSFAYDDKPLLKDINFSIEKGKIIGILGNSGSGKSTMLKLLMRFWDIDKGLITISNTDIKSINTQSLRENEGFVTQGTQIFHDTVKNNLLIAKLDATDEDIETACKKASIHDFIKTLPKGYDTVIQEQGETLSGGERQRIGLARSFLHDAPFLLLDEPTSNIDSLNEAVILSALEDDRKSGRTVILVSHKYSTVSISDEIYLMENGNLKQKLK